MSVRDRNLLATAFLIFILMAIPVAAVIQTVWLNTASDGQEERLRRGLLSATRQIRADLALEMASARTLLRPELEGRTIAGTEPVEALDETFPEYFDAWSEQSRFPDLLRQIYYVDSIGSGDVYLYDTESRQFAPAEDPPDWIRSGRLPFPDLSGSEVPTTLVLLIPLDQVFERFSTPEGTTGIRVVDSGYLVALVDRDYLSTVVLPELVTTYLGSDDYEVTVSAGPDVLWSTGGDSDTTIPINPHDADEVLALSVWSVATVALSPGPEGETDFSIPPQVYERYQDPLVQQWLEFRPPRDEVGDDRTVRDVPFQDSEPPGLTVAFQHTAGSIRAAATQTRDRNLLISYIALVMLAGATVVYYLLFRKANRQREREHEFVATVTHELRTPVAAINAVADNLSEGIVKRPEQVQTYGAALLDEGRRLRLMIDQVLSYAGLQGGSARRHTTNVDLEELVLRVCARVPEMRRDHFVSRIEPNLPLFRGDAVGLELIIHNLISNAFKHNPPGTSVRLTVSAERGSRRSGSCHLRIEVKDDGRGIPRSERRKVRDPFFRGAQSQADQIPGSGLGLSLVNRIVQSHAGSLEISGDAGTTVLVRLPFENGDPSGS